MVTAGIVMEKLANGYGVDRTVRRFGLVRIKISPVFYVQKEKE